METLGRSGRPPSGWPQAATVVALCAELEERMSQSLAQQVIADLKPTAQSYGTGDQVSLLAKQAVQAVRK